MEICDKVQVPSLVLERSPKNLRGRSRLGRLSRQSFSFLLLEVTFATNVILPVVKIDVIKVVLDFVIGGEQFQEPAQAQQLTVIDPPGSISLLLLLTVVRRALQATPQVQGKVTSQII